MTFTYKTTAICLAILFVGCAGTPKNTAPVAPNNLGSAINSGSDEYAPWQLTKKMLIFSSSNQDWQTKKNKSDQAVFYSRYNAAKGFSAPEFADDLPLANIPGSGYPTIFSHAVGQKKEMLFAAPNGGTAQAPNIDIFHVNFNGKQWEKPTLLGKNVNSEHWDSQPFFSPDGSAFVFASDRGGKQSGIDIFLVAKDKEGKWGEPTPLTEDINSSYDEYSPFWAPDGKLYFSTKMYSSGKRYDVAVAENDNGIWKNPRPVPSPVNTEFNEITPAVWNDSLLLASDRLGGAGGYDLYAFPLCGPVHISGKVVIASGEASPTGAVEAINRDNKTVGKALVDERGYFRMEVPARAQLLLRYLSPCIPGTFEKHIKTPCSESSAISLAVEFTVEKRQAVFTFEEYNVPFFASGYYRPNTTENLEALRLKFTYGLIGNDDTTRYIEKPGIEYDRYAAVVDSALLGAYRFLAQRIALFDTTPCTEESLVLNISVVGYADPRPLYDLARYNEETISDELCPIEVKQGKKMDNETLSILRAYFTAQHLRQKLMLAPGFKKHSQKIRWKTEGKGVDASDGDYLRKRRVEIMIDFSPQKK